MICDLESKINKLLSLSKTNELLTYWTKNDILKRINNIESNNIVPSRHSELLAYMYQGSGIKIQNLSEDEAVKFYKKSYDIWKTIWYSNKDKDDIDYIKQLFYLVSTGIISDSLAEVRMILMEIDLDKYLIEQDETEWTKYLEDRVYLIILILLRKKDGWNDIKLVDKIIENIQIAQKSKEDIYLSKLDREDLYDEICWIGSLLNILEAVEYYKKYILTGKPENIEKIITRYCIDSQELLKQANRSDRNFIFILIEKVLKKMVSISLWASVSGISEKIDEYIKLLTDETNNKPIFELWPSQQQAISKNIFDTNKTAIVVQMPTSAGKTLIAKFYILQTLNLYANAKIAYIVPTRALVNQVKRDLRYDFGRIGINVDISIPYNDIEGMEDQLLLKDTDIIRLDMSEFKEEHSISKIIGSPPGYVGFENKNTILDKIKENSNSVILLDEIEKAHPSVVNLFLQALDEGIMKTSTNEVIRLYNNIIIMTSNIGYKKNQVGFNEKSQNIITNEIKETLGIEFVNRIDKVLIFDRLNEASIKKIILKEIDKLRDNFNLDKKRLIIKPQVIENIIQETKYKEFGARRVEKIIKDKLYDTVIDEMLNKSVKITIETI